MTRTLRAFGELRKVFLLEKNLRLSTKTKISNACVLSEPLYGVQCWFSLRRHKNKLDTFYHQRIRTILGISNRQQWSEQITMAKVRRRWGDEEMPADKVKRRSLEWLGHLVRIDDDRLQRSVLFSWVPQPRLRCGPRKRWIYIYIYTCVYTCIYIYSVKGLQGH